MGKHKKCLLSGYTMYIMYMYIFRIMGKGCRSPKNATNPITRIHIHMYGTAKKKRPGYLVGNLVATNWPIEKALHAIGYNQIPTK